ncbi:MAG: hypothetical protein ACPKPY_07115 [Nitrososphaeraceae archaeon]
MLGDLIYEGQGRITGSRILNAEENKIEYTLIEEGKFKDIPVHVIATFWTIPAGKNTVHSESQAIITTKDSVETATYKAYGIGRYSESGGTSFRGTVFYKTTIVKLSFLNNMIYVFEAESDKNNHSAKIWEWN